MTNKAIILVLVCLFLPFFGFAGGRTQEVETPEGTISIGEYKEAPMLAARVAAGELPAVTERLPLNPVVVQVEQIGKYGGMLRQGVTTRHAAINSMLAGRFLDGAPFTWNAAAGELSPNWAEDGTISSDGKTFTLTIREGVKWSDGVPVTTDDIMFGYNSMQLNETLRPEGPSKLLANVDVEQVDQYTVKFHLAEPNPLFKFNYQEFGYGGAPYLAAKHYFSQFHPDYVDEKDLTAMAKEEGLDTWDELYILKGQNDNPDRPNLHLWVLKEATTERVITERNPYYWKVDQEGNQLPYIDGLRIDMITSADVVTAKAMAGEFDFAFYHLNFADFPTLKANEASGGYAMRIWGNAGGASHLKFNQNYKDDPEIGKLLRTPDFKKALSIAINREEVNELVFLGQGNPAQISPPVGSQLYNAEWTKMYATYDPAKAKRMLDDLGVKDTDSDGWRENPDGGDLLMEINADAGVPQYVSTSELIVGYWEEIGLQTRLNTMTFERRADMDSAGAYITSINKLDMIIYPLYVRNSPMNRFANGALAPDWQNYMLFKGEQGEKPTPEFMEAYDIFDKLVVETDDVRRLDLARQLWENFYENLWTAGVIQESPVPILVSNKLKNVPMTVLNAWPLRTPSNAGLAYWYLDQ
jgi:peptide/nickel transport system substrate-binding protein